MKNWLITFLDKTPAELTVGEAVLMLLVIGLAVSGICLVILKGLSSQSRSIRLPKAPPGTVNPFLEVLKKRRKEKL